MNPADKCVCMETDVKAQLDRIEHDTSRIARAVFGEPEAGHQGLVHDMNVMKEFKEKTTLKAAGVAGGVTVAAFAIKSVWAKLFP